MTNQRPTILGLRLADLGDRLEDATVRVSAVRVAVNCKDPRQQLKIALKDSAS